MSTPPTPTLKAISCDRRHAPEILDILNEAIVTSTALYDYKLRTPQMMEGWFDTKEKGRYPILGVEDENGKLLGFASYGSFRAWPAYKYSVEHSVYVKDGQRGKGIGKQLLVALVAAATQQDYHTMVGGIDSTNRVSISLHERLGFKKNGTIQQAGFKFGRWLDLDFYQLLLPTPSAPVDG